MNNLPIETVFHIMTYFPPWTIANTNETIFLNLVTIWETTFNDTKSCIEKNDQGYIINISNLLPNKFSVTNKVSLFMMNKDSETKQVTLLTNSKPWLLPIKTRRLLIKLLPPNATIKYAFPQQITVHRRSHQI